MSDFDLKELERRMKGAVEVMKREFGGLRSGRATTSLLEPVRVEAYGSEMPLSQVGTVGAPEPRLLTVQVWDTNLTKAVEKAIRDAGLGLNPQAEGSLIRVPIPELNEERRKELTRVASKYAEQAKVAVRNVRRDGMDSLKKMEKSGDISQDEHHREGQELQTVTDKQVKVIDDLLAAKEGEIMAV